MITNLDYKVMYENELIERIKLLQKYQEMVDQNHKLAVEITQLVMIIAGAKEK